MNTNRTNPKQFEIMIAFMEKHGDLLKARRSVEARVLQERAWGQLVARLQAESLDGAPPRSIDQWKKVWSDLKNNTKRKLMKLKMRCSTPSGPPAAGPLRLSRNEARVLTVIGLIKGTVPLRLQLAPKVGIPPPDPPSAPAPADPLWHSPPPLQPAPLVLYPSSPPQIQPKTEFFEIELEQCEGGAPLEEQGGGGAPPEQPPEQGGGYDELDADSVRGPTPAPAEDEPPAPAPLRPSASGHTTTRGVSRRARSGLERAVRRLARGAARRRRREREWRHVCTRGLALLEDFLNRVEPSVRATREDPGQAGAGGEAGGGASPGGQAEGQAAGGSESDQQALPGGALPTSAWEAG